jgi:hypothetical protein
MKQTTLKQTTLPGIFSSLCAGILLSCGMAAIARLQSVSFVMKGGEIVKSP